MLEKSRPRTDAVEVQRDGEEKEEEAAAAARGRNGEARVRGGAEGVL